MDNVKEFFGSEVFDDRVMKKTLSDEVYQSLKKTIDEGSYLDYKVADDVAEAMKNWAIEKGATHFTHWFQPLTGVTAEKHDSFVMPDGNDGIIYEFSGKELIKGEPDASSFPTGGLRATFEARGYTAWDPTSYAFIKDNTLCIPTAFCAFNGYALDKKTPLLRSMDALNNQALRILKMFGHDEVKRVNVMVGAEQEYFLIPKKLFDERIDLKFTGRTLIGAKAPKGQELDDHYYGVVKPQVAAFMKDVDEQLWKLGVLAKTEHNEVAPCQHELACVYRVCNVATDQNQLVMEIMKKTAEKHGLECLLHEKPFDGVNGSGKHNNWSLLTDNGINLLSPGESPFENIQFLLFLAAIIEAVDEYQDLLRISVATASNDYRLGANEAPPTVISMFLGDELTSILNAIEQDLPYEKTDTVLMKLGSVVLPKIRKDNTDRNRTSPFAFTGNKFEFRMPGSLGSIACANIMINSAVSDVLRRFADELENSKDIKSDVYNLIKNTIKKHKHIIFNGNGYDEAWLSKACENGLINYKSTAEAMPHMLDEKNINMFKRNGIYNEVELKSRCEIMLDNYYKTINIEALTLIDMMNKLIIPAIEEYSLILAKTLNKKLSVNPNLKCEYEHSTLNRLSKIVDDLANKTNDLIDVANKLKNIDNVYDASNYVLNEMIHRMNDIRKDADEAETIVGKKYWPIPTYADILFGM